ncbi:MAG: hypothetical protein AAF138_06790 [Planctomycetota bacterium]
MRAAMTVRAAGVLVAGGMGVVASAAHAEPTILTVAPADAWMVVHVPSASAFLDPAEGTTLRRLMDDEELANFFDARFVDVREAWEERAAALDLELDELPRPSGAAGIAIVDVREPGEPLSFEGGVASVVWADFGDEIDAAEEAIDQLLDDAIEAGTVTFEETLVGDVELVTVTQSNEAGEDDEEVNDWDEGAENAGSVTFGRIGSAYIMSENADVAIEAAEAAMGEGRGGTIGDAADVSEALASHPAEAEAFVVLRMDPIREGWMTLFEDLDGLDGRVFAEVLGLRDVESISLSIDLDAADGPLAMAAHVEMDTKDGLFALAAKDSGTLSPPAFVRAGAASVSRGRVEFREVIPLIIRVLSNLPEDQREQAAFFLEQARGIAEPVLNAIGPEFYQVSRFDEPFAEIGASQLFATRVSNEDVVANTLSLLGGFANAAPRDFAGVTIFDLEMEGQSGAVSGGWLYLGTTATVEDAIRSGGGAGGEGSLAEQDSFMEAMDVMEGSGVASGYMDLGRTLEWLAFDAKRSIDQAEAFADAMDMSAEDRLVFLGASAWIDELPRTEAVTDVIGDFVWSMRSTRNGYRLRMLCLEGDG